MSQAAEYCFVAAFAFPFSMLHLLFIVKQYGETEKYPAAGLAKTEQQEQEEGVCVCVCVNELNVLNSSSDSHIHKHFINTMNISIQFDPVWKPKTNQEAFHLPRRAVLLVTYSHDCRKAMQSYLISICYYCLMFD